MAAMAGLIDFYGWKEVIVVLVDDDYGRNGISALHDELDNTMSRISHNLALPVQYNLNDIADLLNKFRFLGRHVYIGHVDPDPRLRIFTVAKELLMMTSNYVWFATDWLSTTVDSFSPMNRTSLTALQGVVTLPGQPYDVFNEALKLVPYDVPYRFEPSGDGQSNPSYDELVKMVAENVQLFNPI
ncbi:glutamate receptor 3.7 [Pyrus ussuriensis x Pyrus communis]|uniref:Glutamate receptor 3.7 n=1 Tax=Pyrus ussuriensis x Pyrus communis TaxID=2448454 RepID=A0A5N5GES1_9ROSA|nr:glutamate receptor 3.7 [Pyrus ussuriensis x Pyrus communis]